MRPWTDGDIELALDRLSKGFDRVTALGQGGTKGRKITLVPLSNCTMKQTDWLWEMVPGEGRIPMGAITLFCGREDLGKSTIMSWMAAEVQKGLLPGDLYGKSKGVVIVTVEGSYERTIVPQLKASGADVDRVFKVEVSADETMPGLDLPGDLKVLEELLVENDIGLVIIDPLTTVLKTVANKQNDYGPITEALWPIAHMAERQNVPVVGIMHLTKSQSLDAMNMVMGSRGFGTVARAGIMLLKHPEDPDRRVISQAMNNQGRRNIPGLTCHIEAKVVGRGPTKDITGTYPVWGDSDPRLIDELLEASSQAARRSKGPSALIEAQVFLSDLLDKAGGEMPAKEIKAEAALANISEITLERAKTSLGVLSKRSKKGGAWAWYLPDATDQDHQESLK